HHRPRALLRAQRLRAVAERRERLGVVRGLVPPRHLPPRHHRREAHDGHGPSRPRRRAGPRHDRRQLPLPQLLLQPLPQLGPLPEQPGFLDGQRRIPHRRPTGRTGMSADRRFPRGVYGQGEEPDPRFSLANERTFLAWLRTALAMYAAAFALEALSLPELTGWRIAAAAVFLALGTLAVVQAWIGWRSTERSLRRAEPLPGLSPGAVLVVGAVIAAALVTIGLYA